MELAMLVAGRDQAAASDHSNARDTLTSGCDPFSASPWWIQGEYRYTTLKFHMTSCGDLLCVWQKIAHVIEVVSRVASIILDSHLIDCYTIRSIHMCSFVNLTYKPTVACFIMLFLLPDCLMFQSGRRCCPYPSGSPNGVQKPLGPTYTNQPPSRPRATV